VCVCVWMDIVEILTDEAQLTVPWPGQYTSTLLGR
jgi:hypothetical protein